MEQKNSSEEVNEIHYMPYDDNAELIENVIKEELTNDFENIEVETDIITS